MPRPVYRQRWAWAKGMHTAPRGTIPDVQSANLALSSLADKGLITTRHLADFQDYTGLADFAWSLHWNRAALAEVKGDFRALLRRVQGFVIFMHGWCGSGKVWAHLPGLICAANPRLIAFAPDLNGFGRSPFLAEAPVLEQCDPFALMNAVVYWVDMLGLRSGAQAERRRRVITFVGHSMSGAALFHMDTEGWHEHEFARCALSPALLLGAELRHGFYRALGTNDLAKKPPEERRLRLTAQVIDNLTASADAATQAEHLRVFETTPRGTLIQTLYALGLPPRKLRIKEWPGLHVFLGQDDRLLQVSNMIGLLDGLGLAPNQMQVLRGDHFLFAAGGERREVHLINREILVGQILYLHETCRDRQRIG